MQWAAANVDSVSQDPQSESQGVVGRSADEFRRRSAETAEAALSRLTKSYSTAISCVGSLNRASSVVKRKFGEGVDTEESQSTEISRDEAVEQLRRVANAARSSLENSILLDPLIVKYIPTAYETMRSFSEESLGGEGRWDIIRSSRPVPPSLTSSAHRSAIRELAYLSLVNYGDLLLSACGCTSYGADAPSTSILDRGIVERIQFLTNSTSSCWTREEQQHTERLALAAYCDASELEGTDPSLWLRIACTARGLGRTIAHNDNAEDAREVSSAVLRYRRLERHALESGRMALPLDVPPNRTIARALDELNATGIPKYYPSRVLCRTTEATELELNLPRYSWSVLGRMLMRVCREGSVSGCDAFQDGRSVRKRRQLKNSGAFGSPTIVLRLSPMLALPSLVLGTISQFLTAGSIWRFESTCRALSVSMISARASMEQELQKNTEADLPTNETNASTASGTDDRPEPENRDKTIQRSDLSQERQTASHRSSKRVRSQRITSGKLAERSARRNSVEFCFLASTLSCTAESTDYNASLRERVVWESLVQVGDSTRGRSSSSRGTSVSVDQGYPGSVKTLHLRNRLEASERSSDGSMTSFIENWSGRNSGPLDVLSKFVTHVSKFSSLVFTTDMMSLASCVIEIIDHLSKKRGFPSTYEPSWYGSEQDPVDTGHFAVNLLNAELRLKRCERHAVGQDYNHDANAVSVLVPILLRMADTANGTMRDRAEEKFWEELKTRCHWLAAGFFLWRSRVSQNVSESRKAEALGLEQVGETIECLKGDILSRTIRTPHLESPSRTDPHWKYLSVSVLSAFRDDVQAASVVSLAQQQFLEVVEAVGLRWTGNNVANNAFSEEDIGKLMLIGEQLFKRYDVVYEGRGGKHEELVDDFRLSCADDLIRSHLDKEMDLNKAESRWEALWNLVPSSTPSPRTFDKTQNLSILTILVSCLQLKPDSGLAVVLLLTRLVLATYDQHGLLDQDSTDHKSKRDLRGNSAYDSDENEGFSDSVSSDESDDGTLETSSENRKLRRNPDVSRGRMICRMSEFFIDKISDICSRRLSIDEKKEFVACGDFLSLVHFSLTFAAEWCRGSTSGSFLLESPFDIRIFSATRSLVSGLLERDVSTSQRLRLESVFFVGLSRILVSQRQIFPSLLRPNGDNRSGRTARQKVCVSRAEYVGAVASEAACMLSRNLLRQRNGGMPSSFLIDALHGDSVQPDQVPNAGKKQSARALASLCDSVLWFWKYGSSSGVAGNPAASMQPSSINSFDRPIIERLLAPVASALVGICGTAVCSSLGMRADKQTDPCLCLSEFFDSDASANDWVSDSDDSNESPPKPADRSLHRSVCQAVQCVALVFDGLNEKFICTPSSYPMYSSKHGPSLPLVGARVLNHFCEILLTEYASSSDYAEKQRNIWSKEYSFGARTTGNRLDSSLHKVYRCLHGFSLVSGTVQGNVSKEQGTGTASHDELAAQRYPPESATAAAQLYRCIVRAYAKGRKSPPKAALECVLSALPPVVESEKAKGIRNFLFSAAPTYFEPSDVSKLMKKGISAKAQMRSLPVGISEKDDLTENHETDELFLVRKGVSHEMAKGPLPQLSSVSLDIANYKDHNDIHHTEEREKAACHERDLSKKFHAILDDLCFGCSYDCEGWYRAGQCLVMKADLIADRVGLSKGFRTADFTISDHNSTGDTRLGVVELLSAQERDYERSREGWVPFLGSDLSLYVRYPWSTFSSLMKMSVELGDRGYQGTHQVAHNGDMFSEEEVAWREVETMYQKEDYIEWQQAWGGMFITALRKVAVRCLCVALCLALKQSEVKPKDENFLVSEISESLGTAYYSMLMGSQEYGFPMHRMTEYRKRQLAETASLCFRHAIDAVSLPDNQDEAEDQQTWDLLFMIGKCHEKIGGSLRRECFATGNRNQSGGIDGTIRSRQYEQQMEKALESYSIALKEANAIEQDGGFTDIQGGGSEHGAVELFYRLHSSRLKCLLFAVRQRSSVRDLAESEALRLVTKHWSSSPPGEDTYNDQMDIRERVWAVLADVVAALAQCRLEQPFFHRSVYRHAQALMWAQVFHDPAAGKVEHGLGTVPATRSYQIRGLNSATPCVHSAEIIMGSLFEKKRPQLCAVWVTAPSTPASPFPFLNTSIRKYDSLRGKYLSAWVDCLRLCGRANKLETLLQWTAASKRDLPSFFRSSALSKGGAPSSSHNRDRLLSKNWSLWSLGLLQAVKRQANSALAKVIMSDLPSLAESNDKKAEARITAQLKAAYSCFLRLNCTVHDIERSRAWKFGRDSIPEVEALCQVFLATKDHADVNVHQENWSGKGKKIAVLNAALAACRDQFPGLSSSLYAKSSRKRRQSGASKNSDDPQSPSRSLTKKAKTDGAEQTTKESFLVGVPLGLLEGDTFHTSISVAGIQRKVKLTVPAGKPSKLKFSLTVKKSPTSAREKRPRGGDE